MGVNQQIARGFFPKQTVFVISCNLNGKKNVLGNIDAFGEF